METVEYRGWKRNVRLANAEIELLVTADDVSLPYFPTTRLHALAAARWALGEAAGPGPAEGGIMDVSRTQGG